VVAHPSVATVVTVAGAIEAGVTVVPLNPASGSDERAHVVADSAVEVVVDGDEVIETGASPAPADGALVVYTSGTTGPPKGAVLSAAAVAACLDGLADRWSWTPDDVLAHALPLFHVHGLVLGCLGPLRVGSPVAVLPTFGPSMSATMYFAVPTMWARASVDDLTAMRGARLLVSGSASLPAPVFDWVRSASGHPLTERYGLTESLIVTAAAADGRREPGRVGAPLPGVAVRVTRAEGADLGEIQVSGPTLFSGYLNRPDATAAAYTGDGWFRTGDLGRLEGDGGLRVLGRIATDLVKTGGYKVGVGEVEDALLTHPAVAEAAVVGEADDDLGERIVAWVVRHGAVTADELVTHVASRLAPHKRPRTVRFVQELPRNAMGKVRKDLLRTAATAPPASPRSGTDAATS
jgi:fatty acid CoA ligase FadD36/malonyl-CoA/methylmalonyl-CoA synthetase